MNAALHTFQMHEHLSTFQGRCNKFKETQPNLKSSGRERKGCVVTSPSELSGQETELQQWRQPFGLSPLVAWIYDFFCSGGKLDCPLLCLLEQLLFRDIVADKYAQMLSFAEFYGVLRL